MPVEVTGLTSENTELYKLDRMKHEMLPRGLVHSNCIMKHEMLPRGLVHSNCIMKHEMLPRGPVHSNCIMKHEMLPRGPVHSNCIRNNMRCLRTSWRLTVSWTGVNYTCIRCKRTVMIVRPVIVAPSSLNVTQGGCQLRLQRIQSYTNLTE